MIVEMCGRFTLRTPASVLIEMFGLGEGDAQLPLFEPRYNIAPTQSIWAVRDAATGGDAREAVQLHWGLIPTWAKDATIGNRMINARGETAAEKPAFRTPFRRQRCLVMTDGYYEWQKGGTGPKQPYYFHRPDDGPFAFACLWERWQDKTSSIKERASPQRSLFHDIEGNIEGDDGENEEAPVIESCTIITTTANALAAEVHDRMPVILQPSDYAQWLDRDEQDVERLLVPLADDEFLVADPVSTFVNKPTNDGRACIEPI